MGTKVIPFRCPEEPPDPYGSRFAPLSDVPPARRAATNLSTFQQGMIDRRDAEIFLASWLDIPSFHLALDLGQSSWGVNP